MKNVFENLLVGIFILFLYAGMIVFGIYIGALIVEHVLFFTCAFLLLVIYLIGWLFRKL